MRTSCSTRCCPRFSSPRPPFRSAAASSHANTSECSLHQARKCLRNRRIGHGNVADAVTLTRFAFFFSGRSALQIVTTTGTLVADNAIDRRPIDVNSAAHASVT